ncbi:Phosphatidylglycerol lysyltransferase [Sphingobacterium spiritivorum]|uniref:Phosphatidylglycerol lysyltransferase n=1 Tax=Sphingobacterium spiritivorum TaxID=258 RepID=A0A380CMW6_SPHSI|nr:flippase-like domain-containing protein [Sphingobacterium spiritivorum]SUJ24423.1 Phosphatidylglycerol lysyltransferase [Sphingobacterium spiritivorum]
MYIFFTNQRHELASSLLLIKSSSLFWIAIGIVISLTYIAMQGLVYVYSFKSVRQKLSLGGATRLFLKRNFISVFLPAGGFTSLAFFKKEVNQEGISDSSSNLASIIYALISLVSLFVLCLVVFLFVGIGGLDMPLGETMLAFTLLLGGFGWYCRSFYQQGKAYHLTIRYFPSVAITWDELKKKGIDLNSVLQSLIWATVIELVGILHFYIAMLALGFESSLLACTVTYAVGTLVYCFSPLMKGVGLIEVSMVLILSRFGYTEEQAISISLLYRLFEFWGPLALGGMSFFVNKNNIFVRILPSVFIFVMGIINIISVLTPAIHSRIIVLKQFVSYDALNISNAAVLFFGILMVMCSGFLLKGLRMAWYVSVVLCSLSILANLSKGLDFEEAWFAFLVLLMLLYSSRHYFVQSNRKLASLNLILVLWLIGVVLLYGITGFYFLNTKHFNIDFTIANAVSNTLHSFILLNGDVAEPQTRVGQYFLYSINFFSVVSLSVLFYWLVNPCQAKTEGLAEKIEVALRILDRYGKSPVDYFKTYGDKEIFLNDEQTGFIAYKKCYGFAVVLEGPVCEDKESVIKELINSFEQYCRCASLKTAYYRVDGKNLGVFKELGKKSFLIGEEAIVNVDNFSLEGKKRKSLRNAVNSIEKKGFVSNLYRAPLSNGLLQKLQVVSDHWLRDMKRSERVFSQGMFDVGKIKNSHVITLEDSEGQILAFLNIIPNYAPDEATYDLIRKLKDAPGGNMDVLIIRFLEYCKEEGYSFLNMGLAPFSGFDKKRGVVERLINFLYENNTYFRQPKGLKEFKDKFDPCWVEKFLVYSHDLDLITVPLVIDKAMKSTIVK